MTHSEKAVELVASFEGCSLVAYQDGNQIWTIGYGRTGGVQPGATCTRSEALNWLNHDLDIASAAVSHQVQVPLTQNQFDALTSFVFNVGSGHFSASTCLKRLNASDYEGAVDGLMMWNKVASAVSPGLVRRRTAEAELFNTPDEANQ